MADKPVLSVVIATYNRCSILTETLKRLAEQSLRPGKFEVLVVDDDSPDRTGEAVNSLISSMPYSLRYFHHKNQGPGFTQNRGIKEARSELVLLMGDDIWTSPGMLEKHVKTHGEYPDENIAVLGKVTQSPEIPFTVMHKYWDPFRYDVFEGKRQLDAIHFLACNISVKRKFLLENGLYKETKGAAHEDIELGYRLGQKGLKIIYEKDAFAHHYHPETLPNACKRAYERGLNFDMLTENIPKSTIYPIYHICTPEAGLKAFIKMLFREIPRMLLFNKWSVNGFWLPVLNRAESSFIAALFANGISYRGTIYYHMRRGIKDLRKNRQMIEPAPKVAV